MDLLWTGGCATSPERLIRLYGEAHNLQAEPRTDGGFNVSIGIPLRDTTRLTSTGTFIDDPSRRRG